MLSLDLWSKWVLELKSLELTDTYGCLGYPSSSAHIRPSVSGPHKSFNKLNLLLFKVESLWSCSYYFKVVYGLFKPYWLTHVTCACFKETPLLLNVNLSCWGHCLRRTTFFQFSDKKAICLRRKQIKILGIPRNRELNWTFLSILSKIIFFYFKVTIILFNFILQSWGSMILLSRNLYLFLPSYPLSLSNQATVVLHHWKQYRARTIIHPPMNYWFQCCNLHWALVKCQRPAEECTKNLGDTFHCRHTYIRKNSFFFNFIFPALIDNPNNFEIIRLIR